MVIFDLLIDVRPVLHECSKPFTIMPVLLLLPNSVLLYYILLLNESYGTCITRYTYHDNLVLWNHSSQQEHTIEVTYLCVLPQ